jgi:hypothetical protein
MEGQTPKDDQTKKMNKRTKERKKTKEAQILFFFIIGGANFSFFYKWHKCHLITGGTKVVFFL